VAGGNGWQQAEGIVESDFCDSTSPRNFDVLNQLLVVPSECANSVHVKEWRAPLNNTRRRYGRFQTRVESRGRTRGGDFQGFVQNVRRGTDFSSLYRTLYILLKAERRTLGEVVVRGPLRYGGDCHVIGCSRHATPADS
jgi:hypothetical protein